MAKCRICEQETRSLRIGCRDNPDIKIYRCEMCDYNFIPNADHLKENHYQDSRMHEEQLSNEAWRLSCYEDDVRRFKLYASKIKGKKVCDFGGGAGGFYRMATTIAAQAFLIELDNMTLSHFEDDENVNDDINKFQTNFDYIMLFHVLEHVENPIEFLDYLADHLKQESGRMVIEVPNLHDPLLTLYNNQSFQDHFYWSQHLHYFTPNSLTKIVQLSGLKVVSIKLEQRYGFKNHIGWMLDGTPGGHKRRTLDNEMELDTNYKIALKKLFLTDTILMEISHV